jgi:hypothetical protein
MIALAAIYPEHAWVPWKFSRVGANFWRNLKNQRDYLKWLEVQLQIQRPEDWYNIAASDITDKNLNGFLSHHNNSLSKALKNLYPEVNWQPWKFKHSPRGFWNDAGNVKKYLSSLSEQLHINSVDEWYDVAHKHIILNKGKSLIAKEGGLFGALSKQYPSK